MTTLSDIEREAERYATAVVRKRAAQRLLASGGTLTRTRRAHFTAVDAAAHRLSRLVVRWVAGGRRE